MIDWFVNTLRSYPEIAIFLSLAIGYYFGSFTYKGLGLGAVTATLDCRGDHRAARDHDLAAAQGDVLSFIPVRDRLRGGPAIRARHCEGRRSAGAVCGGRLRVLPARGLFRGAHRRL